MSGGRPSRVVVTGAAGFVGSGLVRHLADEGIEVHALVHPRTDRWRLNGSTAARIHLVDLADRDAVATTLDAVGPAVTIHAAAGRDHARTPAEREALWHDTVAVTEALLEALRRTGAERFVHLGSSLEYTPSDRPLRESDPCHPPTFRGRAKLAATQAVQRWATDHGTSATVLRLFRVYGPGEQEGRLIHRLLEAVRSGVPVATPPTSTRRDYVHLDDVARACLLALERSDPGATVLNVGAGREYTVDEVIRVVEDVTGTAIARDPEPRPLTPHDPVHSVADLSLVRAELGWWPTLTLRDGIEQLYRKTLVG